jgi:hypothetical protein
MSYHCPKCQRLVYNRASSKCGLCGAELPPEFRFTPAEEAAWGERLKRLAELPPPKFPWWRLPFIAVFVAGAAFLWYRVGKGDGDVVFAVLAVAWLADSAWSFIKDKRLYDQYKPTA